MLEDGKADRPHFEVKYGLRQGCVISPWLFNMFVEKVVKPVNQNSWGIGVP